MTRFLIILIGLWLAQAPAATLYVSTNGATPDGQYLTWATAATNIQNAVYAATNDVVLVTNGVYTCASSLSGTIRAMIIMTNSVTLQSVNGPAFTLIDGGNTGEFTNRCFYIDNVNAVVSGFTITNGRANAASPNNIGGGTKGGTLYNCTLTGNSARDGGGAYSSTLYNSTLIGNSANAGGGAGASTLYNCTVTGNSANAGGAAWGGSTLYNSTLIGNSATSGGGAYNSTLYNCTIVSNRAFGAGGGVFGGGGPVCNTIIYSNQSAIANNNNWFTNTANVTFSNCCTYPTNSSDGVLPGTGNITNWPLFMDFAAQNYRLTNNSPCINTGTNQDWMIGATDLDGHRRLDHLFGLVDIGAYEHTFKGTFVSIR